MAPPAPFQLDSERIVDTVQVLSQRIHERFPGAGLHGVCMRLLEIARQAKLRAQQIAEPITWVRVLSGAIVAVIALAFVTTLVLIVTDLPDESRSLGTADLVQMLDAAFNSLLLIGATIIFLVTLETRIKRRLYIEPRKHDRDRWPTRANSKARICRSTTSSTPTQRFKP